MNRIGAWFAGRGRFGLPTDVSGGGNVTCAMLSRRSLPMRVIMGALVIVHDERQEPNVTDPSLSARFEENRPRLRAVAYRLLGSTGEAEDAVQETWLRITRADSDAVDNLGGWLTTVTTHVCLDM